MRFLKTLLALVFIGFITLIGCNKVDNVVSPTKENIKDNIIQTWYIPGDFTTIEQAINDSRVVSGDILKLGDGNFSGVILNKGVSIVSSDNTVINDGPLHGSGKIQGFRLMGGSDGASFSNLIFTVDLDIMCGEYINNVTVSHCKFINSIQAISAWKASGWNINHNTITDLRCDNGGGIGILIGDYAGATISGNLISHNTITGTLHVMEGELGGYAGSGIVFYADFRWGSFGAEQIKENFVTHNTISLTSDNPSLVDIVAFELTDTRDLTNTNIIIGNEIAFNDFRGTTNQIALTPESLDNPVNNITRNLGDNRGHGLHPTNFRP